MSRVVPALLLAAALVAFVPHPAAILLVWAGTAAALIVGLRDPRARAPAAYGLAALVVVAVGTLAGGGVVLRGGGSFASDAFEIFLLAAIATIWIPAGVYLAAGDAGTPRRLARVGLGIVAAWLALFGLVLATGTRDDGHILVLVPGVVVIVVALVWRVVRPVTPRRSDAAPTP